MTIARMYRMTAAAGREEALGAAIVGLADLVRPQPGCEGIELLRDSDAPGSFVFIEKWQSIETHKACLGNLPRDVLAPVMAELAGSPEGRYLEYAFTA